MIITDDVYATFSDDFESLFSRCPFNTLCVYSFSKYFGATGWRLGTIALHESNIFDKLLAELDETTLKKLDKRYVSLTKKPKELAFIDRIVADSRSVALNHTAGISLPQQLQMVLFALSSLLDSRDIYREDAKDLIKRRYNILLQSISSSLTHSYDENNVGYYVLLDLEHLANTLFKDDKFSKWILENMTGAKLLKRLATETGVVLLPGKGFAAEHPSVRVSLVNLREYDYPMIGLALRKVFDELHDDYR
jgi:aspartate 4-decarboxylase